MSGMATIKLPSLARRRLGRGVLVARGAGSPGWCDSPLLGPLAL